MLGAFQRLNSLGMQRLNGTGGGLGPGRDVTDLFNLLQNSPTYAGGPLTATDYLGNLVTSPAGVPALEGGRLATTVAEGATLGPEALSGWNNGTNEAFKFDTLTSVGRAIASAIETSANIGGCASTDIFDVSVGDKFRVTLPITINAGGPVRVTFAGDPSGAGGNRANLVVISESGTYELDYTITAADTTAYFQVNVNTGDTVDLSTGDVSIKRVVPTWLDYVDRKNPVTYVVAVGDSFTATGRYLTRLDTINPYSMLVNAGIQGNKLSDMVARFMADVINVSGRNVAIIQGGVNDITASQLATDMLANTIYMVEMAQSASLPVVLINIGPWSNFISWGAARQVETLAYNSGLSTYAASSNIPIVDMYSLLADGTALAATYDSGDGLHPNDTGYDLLGDEIEAIAGGVIAAARRSSNSIQPSISIPTRSGTKKWYQEPFASAFGYSNWPSRTNLFLNSTVPVTQNITTTAQAYTINVLGTGDVTVSGTATGTATEGSPLTVTATAGTLTCTVTGTLSRVQVEAGAFASPWIDTAGAMVPRSATNLTAPMLALGTQLQLVVIPAATSTAGTLLDDGTNKLSYNGTNLIFTDGVTTLSGVATLTAGTTHAIGVKGLAGDWALSLDTADIDTDVTGSVIAWTPASVNLGRNAADGDHFAGYFPNVGGYAGPNAAWYKAPIGA